MKHIIALMAFLFPVHHQAPPPPPVVAVAPRPAVTTAAALAPLAPIIGAPTTTTTTTTTTTSAAPASLTQWEVLITFDCPGGQMHSTYFGNQADADTLEAYWNSEIGQAPAGTPPGCTVDNAMEAPITTYPGAS